MRKLFYISLIVIFLFSFSLAHAESKVFIIEFEVDKNDNVTMKNIITREGLPTYFPMLGNYTLRLLDKSNNVKESASFDIEFYIVTPPPTPKIVEINKSSLLIGLPYSEEAKKVQLLHNKKIIFERSIEVCNNNTICEQSLGENFLSCPQDCHSGSQDGLCDKVIDKICDPDCSKLNITALDVDCVCNYNGKCEAVLGENNQTCKADCAPIKLEEIIKPAAAIPGLDLLANYWYILVIIILIVVLVILYKRRKPKVSSI